MKDQDYYLTEITKLLDAAGHDLGLSKRKELYESVAEDIEGRLDEIQQETQSTDYE
jgi:hypothetical protein